MQRNRTSTLWETSFTMSLAKMCLLQVAFPLCLNVHVPAEWLLRPPCDAIA